MWFVISHDNVIKWNHFPLYWPLVRGIHRSPVNSPHKGQWRAALMLSLICVWINVWVNNREAGDLRRYRAHYDVNVMQQNSPVGCHDVIVYLWDDRYTFPEVIKSQLTRLKVINNNGAIGRFDQTEQRHRHRRLAGSCREISDQLWIFLRVSEQVHSLRFKEKSLNLACHCM